MGVNHGPLQRQMAKRFMYLRCGATENLCEYPGRKKRTNKWILEKIGSELILRKNIAEKPSDFQLKLSSYNHMLRYSTKCYKEIKNIWKHC